MIRELSLKELYAELETNPDLRRLGQYKLIPTEGQTVFPIDIDFEGKAVYLGDGDYTEGFLALASTKAAYLDFGNCKFYDLYLDEVNVEHLVLGEARASRLYFDYAKIGKCQFKDFVAPEVYFDEADIEHIHTERLSSGIIYLDKLHCPGFESSDLSSSAYRVVEGDKQSDIVEEARDISRDSASSEVRIITTHEFIDLINENPDLSRLGPYKVVSAREGDESDIFSIALELKDRSVIFGEGDFSGLKVRLIDTKVPLLDLADSKFDEIDFVDAEIGNCFLARGELRELRFGSAKIGNIFGERCSAVAINLESLTCGQFNANEMRSPGLHLGEARIREMYFSRGEGIGSIYFDEAQLELLNLHEGRVKEVHFGESEVKRALINKASIEELNIEGLIADELYIGDYRNEIDILRFSRGIEGVRAINIEGAFHSPRPVLGAVEGYASKLPRQKTKDIVDRTDDTEKDSYDPELEPKHEGERDIWRDGPGHGEKFV